MPNIRIMTWNIEKLSDNKTNIAGMANNIARVIVDANVDIAIIQELGSYTGPLALFSVANRANAISALAAGGPVNDYRSWFISYPSGGEAFGVLIKDLDVVRPIYVVVELGKPNGSQYSSLVNLNRNRFATWPGTFAAIPNAYGAGVVLPLKEPLPLIDIYATSHLGYQRQFSGQARAAGGFALGRGSRLPCLAMFEILTGGGATYLVPIVVCHLASLIGGAALARGQLRQLIELHISEKFQNTQALHLPFGGYINLNNTATAIQELIITGDFNVDFQSVVGPDQEAYFRVSPAVVGSGSAAPGALPGNPQRYNPMPPHAPIAGIPAVPFAPVGNPPGPGFNTINDLILKTANTHQRTWLKSYPLAFVPVNTHALRGAAFDNFFFGGTQLSATYQNLPPVLAPADAAEVIDLPAQIVNGGAAGGVGALNVSGAQNHYNLAGTHNAAAAPNLAAGAGGVPTLDERLIGARFISDHLPVVVQFNLP